MIGIRAAVEAESLRLHRVRWDQLARLRAAAEQAIEADAANPGYLAELARWTGR